MRSSGMTTPIVVMPLRAPPDLGAWAISIGVHLLVLLVLALVLIVSLDDKDRVPVRAATIPPPTDEPDPPQSVKSWKRSLMLRSMPTPLWNHRW